MLELNTHQQHFKPTQKLTRRELIRISLDVQAATRSISKGLNLYHLLIFVKQA